MRADRRGVDVGDELHRVRVAHRQHRDVDASGRRRRAARAAAVAGRRRAAPGRAASNGTAPRSKTGRPMSTVTRPSSLQAQLEHVVHASRPAFVRLSVRPLVAHEAHEAARAVAALLDLVAAAAVEDAVAEVDAGRLARLDDEDLVGADAETPVAEAAHLRGGQRERRARRVEHDEVVARALHLGEAQPSCARIIRFACAQRRVVQRRLARPAAS